MNQALDIKATMSTPDLPQPIQRKVLTAVLPSPFTHPNASLYTPRLLLRPILDTDAEGFYAIRSLPEVVQWSYVRFLLHFQT